ncbi:MAG: hypothetical protein SGPRY_012441 [Prymnesium sp.]
MPSRLHRFLRHLPLILQGTAGMTAEDASAGRKAVILLRAPGQETDLATMEVQALLPVAANLGMIVQIVAEGCTPPHPDRQGVHPLLLPLHFHNLLCHSSHHPKLPPRKIRRLPGFIHM